MSEQMELELMIKHSFEPNAKQVQPPIWIEEIRVYRDYDPSTEQCKYPLRPGMNILWADPGKRNVKLYASGISGHAAGKTTFCRLLRYLLGEPEVGTRKFREHLANWEPNATLVGKVWIDMTSWIVCRPLAVNDTEYVVKSDDIEKVFDSSLPRLEYDSFFQALQKQGCGDLLGKILPSGNREITWRRMLPWISRDQECRLSKLTAWRDPSTESNTPETTLADACYIIRRALKLVFEGEDRLHREHRKLTETRKLYEADVPLLKHQAEQGMLRLKGYMNDFTQEGELLITACRDKLNQELKQLVETDEMKLQQARVEKADEELAAALEDQAVSRVKLYEHEELLKKDRVTLKVLQGDVKQELARQEMNDEDPAPVGRCNVPLRIAQREGCTLARGQRIDFQSHKNLMTLDEKIAAYEEQIDLMVAELGSLKHDLQGKKTRVEAKRTERQKYQETYNLLAADLESQKGIIRQQLNELENIRATVDDHREKEAKLEDVRKKETAVGKDLNSLRRQAESQKMRVNDLFEDITKAVLGEEVTAKFTAYAEYIDLNVACRGARESSATSTVQILAFDLAALLLGAEGEAVHPGLLIHDSPREADMAPDVYQRFFLYLREIEKVYGEQHPNYQYIVTTTEPPPQEVLKNPWLIGRLDASKPETRLLGVDLV